MTLVNDQIWTVSISSERLLAIRSDLDAALDTTLDYDLTADGAWTRAQAELAYRQDQGMALALATMLTVSAPPAALYARAVDAGLTPRPAVANERLMPVNVTSGPLLLSPDQKVVDDQGRTWTIIGALEQGTFSAIELNADGKYSIDNQDLLHLLAPFEGAIVVTSFSFTPTISGVSFVSPSSGAIFVGGRDAETPAQLRARLAGTKVSPSGSATGLHTGLMEIDGVEAVSITESAGSIEVAFQTSSTEGGVVSLIEIPEAVYRLKAAGIATTGSSGGTITGVDGFPVQISFGSLSTTTVAVVAALITDGTISDTDAIAAAEVAISGVFATLSPGDPIRLLALQAAIGGITGVIGLTTLTLDGGTADITPSTSTTLLTPALPMTVTVTP